MSEKNRVEIHDFKDWKAGVYLIEAGCGQGKNYFVFNTLFPYAHENGKRMLVFSNRVALREQQQAQTQEKDVKLITYQSLEHDEYLETMQDTKNKVRGLMQQVGEYDYIILDEAHYLYQDAPFNKNTETIIELIEKYRSSKIIVLLSATPDLLKKYLRIDKPYFFKADYSYIKEVQYYTKRDTLDEIISKIPENEKIVVFADSKDRLKELHSEYPNSAYLDASNKKRRKVFNQIIERERFDCRILFTTRVSDNGINLTDKDIKHIIIETTDIVEFMQCLGRKRSQDENDTINLYFLDDIGRISGSGMIGYFKLDKFSSVSLKELLHFSMPIVPSSIALWVVNLSDRLIIIHFMGAAANGIYAVANKIPSLYSTAYGIFNLAWTETASKVSDDGDPAEYYTKLFSGLFKFLIGVMLALIAVTPIIFSVLVKGDYGAAFFQVPILYFGIFFNSLVNFYSGIYIALKRTKQVGYSSVAGAIINAAINVLLIGEIGLYAASISTAVSFLVIAIYRAIDLNKVIEIKYNMKEIAVGMGLFFMATVCLNCNQVWAIILCWCIAGIYNITQNMQIAKKMIRKFLKK